MKKRIFYIIIISIISFSFVKAEEKKDLKINLDTTGRHFVQFTFLNQAWVRFNESNAGTLVDNELKSNTLDLGLRRTRFQIIAPISDRVMFYGQVGMNNFNAQFNTNGGNRKAAFFIHDALGEYKISKGNELKLGAGLTICNGLSRFSQPSIGTIMTLDVPVFAQTTVDQTDEFSRKLSMYARGQIGQLDYRLVLSDPFPITSNGSTAPALSNVANFSTMKHNKQFQVYLIWQFFEHENHLTPYMTGTYLGKKKIFNIAAGVVHQANAMWVLKNGTDTSFEDMTHFCVESFLDMPINKEKKTAISAYLGYFNLNYGTNYLRYNGIMNPANGTSTSYIDGIKGQGPTYGNSFPMFGTGQTLYGQVGYLFHPKNFSGFGLMPYASATISKYDRLQGLYTVITDLGVNLLLNDARNKISLDWQTRPTYSETAGIVTSEDRKSSVTLQYQIFF